MLKTPDMLVSMTSFHCSRVILWNMASRVMPALLTSTEIGPSSASTWDAGAQAVVGDRPFVDRNARSRPCLRRGGVIAGIVRRNRIAVGCSRSTIAARCRAIRL
jgi:hypothetical protein